MKATFQNVNLELIDRPKDLVRLEILGTEIEELADSIRERGLQQPIKVARREGRFTIIFGDRRFLACKLLAGKTIRATVVDATDEDIAIDRAIENIQRVDLSPLEEALQYQAMIDKLGFKVDQVGKKVGKKLGTVKRRLDLLKYPTNIKEAVHSKKITLSLAEEIMNCQDPGYRDYLLEMAVEHGVTSALMRIWVQDWRKSIREERGVDSEGGGGPNVNLSKTSYMTCGLCDGPFPIEKVRSITVCDGCLGKLHELLSGLPEKP